MILSLVSYNGGHNAYRRSIGQHKSLEASILFRTLFSPYFSPFFHLFFAHFRVHIPRSLHILVALHSPSGDAGS